MIIVGEQSATQRNAGGLEVPKATEGVACDPPRATKHGLRIDCPLFAEIETLEEWQRHREGYLRAYEPVGPIETSLTEDAAVLGWRRARATTFEVDSLTPDIQKESSKEGEAGGEDATRMRIIPKPQSLNAIVRYESFIRRSLRQVLADLGKLQHDRLSSAQKGKDATEGPGNDDPKMDQLGSIGRAIECQTDDSARFALNYGLEPQSEAPPVLASEATRVEVESRIAAESPAAVDGRIAAETAVKVVEASPVLDRISAESASGPETVTEQVAVQPEPIHRTRRARKLIERRRHEEQKRLERLERLAQTPPPANVRLPVRKSKCKSNASKSRSR